MKLLEEKNTIIEAKVLDAGIALGHYPSITELYYNLENLIITIDPNVNGKILRVIFNDVEGFRCLDEINLTEFWANKVIRDNWFFEITAGGWLDQENKRVGFVTQEDFREFLICGVVDCVSVVSINPPIFEINETTLNSEM